MCEQAFDAELANRLTTWHEQASLSPAVATVVTEAVDHRSQPRSLLLTLVRVSADAVADERHSPPRDVLLDVSTALVALGGYARLRADVLDTVHETTARERDVAILASDYLHASAHASLSRAGLPADRHVELYRTLTAGSDALTTHFLGEVAEPTNGGERGSQSGRNRGRSGNTEPTAPLLSSSVAVLAGTACALGSVAAGASRDLVEATQRYGESLLTVTESIDTTDGDPLELTERVLTGHETARTHHFDGIHERESADVTQDGEATSSSELSALSQSQFPSNSKARAVPLHLERARNALEAVPETDAKVRLERATTVLASIGDPHDDTETP